METLFGTLVGTAMDPVTWIPALVVCFQLRKRPWYHRLAVVAAVAVIIAALFAFAARPGNSSVLSASILGVLITLAWALVGVGAIRTRQ